MQMVALYRDPNGETIFSKGVHEASSRFSAQTPGDNNSDMKETIDSLRKRNDHLEKLLAQYEVNADSSELCVFYYGCRYYSTIIVRSACILPHQFPLLLIACLPSANSFLVPCHKIPMQAPRHHPLTVHWSYRLPSVITEHPHLAFPLMVLTHQVNHMSEPLLDLSTT